MTTRREMLVGTAALLTTPAVAESPDTEIKHYTVLWDWKDNPCAEDLNEALKHVFNGKDCPFVNDVDTGGDCYAIVLTSKEVSEDEAQYFFDGVDEMDDEEYEDYLKRYDD